MGVEIERKYLVEGESWREQVEEEVRIDQGYITRVGATVRVRTWNDTAYLTIKGQTTNMTRSEWEWEIPHEEGLEMLEELCGERRLIKTRYIVNHHGHEWVIDEFEGDHRGLVMAEIELEAEDESFDLPEWAGDEVTQDSRYYNATLASAGVPGQS